MYKLKKWKLTKYSITKIEECDKWEEQSSLGILGMTWIILIVFTALPYPNVCVISAKCKFCMCKNVLFLKSHITSVRIMFSFSLSVKNDAFLHVWNGQFPDWLHSHVHSRSGVGVFTRRKQQEPHGRPGWFEWRTQAAFSSTLVILVTWTNSSSSPEVWRTVSSDIANSFSLKGIFPV